LGTKTLRRPEHKALMAVIGATRREAGLTQRELGKRLHKPHSYVAKIENGERRLDVVEFVEIAEALQIKPGVLFDRFLHWRR
jgi:transcriptional regulator with XRE-family HTH domain